MTEEELLNTPYSELSGTWALCKLLLENTAPPFDPEWREKLKNNSGLTIDEN